MSRRGSRRTPHRVCRFWEVQDDEGPGRPGVCTCTERHDLERGLALLGAVDEVPELLVHDFWAAHRAADDRLVEDCPQTRPVLARQDALAFHADLHSALDVIPVQFTGCGGPRPGTGPAHRGQPRPSRRKPGVTAVPSRPGSRSAERSAPRPLRPRASASSSPGSTPRASASAGGTAPATLARSQATRSRSPPTRRGLAARSGTAVGSWHRT